MPSQQKYTVFTDIEVFKQIFEENEYTVYPEPETYEDEHCVSVRTRRDFVFKRPNTLDEQEMKENFIKICDVVANLGWEVIYIIVWDSGIYKEESVAPFDLHYITVDILGRLL